MSGTRYPFEVSFVELANDIEIYIQQVFEALANDYLADFLVIPRGLGFVSAETFGEGFEALKRATNGFRALDSEAVYRAIMDVPMALVVLRTILGLSAPEWASVTSVRSREDVTQGFARSLERSIRMEPDRRIGHTTLQETRIRALVSVGCQMLLGGSPRCEEGEVHRLDKIDTAGGLDSLAQVAGEGVRYESLLYERFLGRPFASHRDSVSELVGDALEDRIEACLLSARVSFHRSKRGESIPGWDQNPDFFCPDPGSPTAIIEAKMTNDDGTARDKVARVLRLAGIRDSREPRYQQGFEVIACIGGRGFAVRKGDMRDLLLATHGKVFTFSQIDRLPEFVSPSV